MRQTRVGLRSKQSVPGGAVLLPDLQLVGICTVHRSSEDSSVDVPMKSKFRQLWVSLSSCMSKPCWLSSFKFRFFPEACKNYHVMSPTQSLLSSKLAARLLRRLLSQKRSAVFQLNKVLFPLQKRLLFCHLNVTMKIRAPYLLQKHETGI